VIQSLHRIAISAELGVSYFYFDYKNQHLQRAEQVTRCLLKQLLLQLKELPLEVDEAYDLWIKDGQKSTPDGKCLDGLLKACSTKFSKGVFIVLDALDECREYDEQEKIISYPRDLYHGRIKLFITTRPHVLDDDDLHIRERFTGVHDIRISAQDDDVESYLRTKSNKKN
jgi:hypothetical protein